MNRLERIKTRLRDAFHPALLHVLDESARHAGHAGARPEGETHYRVRMVTDQFRGMGRVQRHRMVNEIIKMEFDGGLHALALELYAPEEAPESLKM
jgi:BolA protein